MRGKLFMEEGRYEQGVEQERKAMEIDPFQRPWAMVYAYTMSHNYDAAIAEAEQQLRPHPDPVTWLIVRVAYDSKRMDKESEHALEEYLTLTNQKAKAEVLHAVFARGGRNAVLQWRLDDLKAQSRTHYASPYLFAYFYAELGDKQHALDYLDECVRQHSPQLLDVQMESAFDPFHSDPHYRAIVQKVGLPPT